MPAPRKLRKPPQYKVCDAVKEPPRPAESAPRVTYLARIWAGLEQTPTGEWLVVKCQSESEAKRLAQAIRGSKKRVSITRRGEVLYVKFRPPGEMPAPVVVESAPSVPENPPPPVGFPPDAV